MNKPRHSLFYRVLLVSVLAHAAVFAWLTPWQAPSSTAMRPLTVSMQRTVPAASAAPLQPAAVMERATVPERAQVSRTEPAVIAQATPTKDTVATPAVASPAVAVEKRELPVMATATAGSSALPEPASAVGGVAAAAQQQAQLKVEEDALQLYRNAVLREVRRVQHYPAQAREGGYSGKVIIRHLVQSGKPDPILLTSSGHPLLDNTGLSMVRLAAERIKLPAALANKTVEFQIPIQFNLLG